VPGRQGRQFPVIRAHESPGPIPEVDQEQPSHLFGRIEPVADGIPNQPGKAVAALPGAEGALPIPVSRSSTAIGTPKLKFSSILS